MKILITESQKQKIALNYLNKKYHPDQLEIVEHPDYPDSIFYRKDGQVIMEIDKKYMQFLIDYDTIWSFFEKVFSMEYDEIQQLMNTWLEETFNLKGFTPIFSNNIRGASLEETFNLKGFTTWYY